jgi:hypothetical protein
MGEGTSRSGWRSIEADGCTWQVRSMSNPDAVSEPGQQLLEFQAEQGDRPPRRLAIGAGSLQDMDDAQLRRAYLKARPIGGDHYGRPGKHMSDAPDAG